MGRRAQPGKGKAKAKRSPGRKAATKGAARVHELEQRLAESLERERAKDRALVEALEHQTATSEILRVISSSPTNEKPVFDAIARSSVRLCGAMFGLVAVFDGELLHLVSHAHVGTAGLEALAAVYPMRPNRGHVAGRAILEGAVVHVPDVTIDPDYTGAPAVGNRATLSVPMLRHGTPIGTMTMGRFEPVPFTDQQIELLKTFADQAVIAIENARLLSELQASNRELTTALDTQTANSDILRVISRSQTDVQPVFDAIVSSAVRLLGAYSGALTRVAGDQIALAALTSSGDDTADAALRAFFPHSVHSGATHAQAIRSRLPFNIADAQADPRVHETVRAYARSLGYYSQIVVPMLRQGEAMGAIAVTRREPGGFTDNEIALLQTFADQAVIAIENARLLTELQQKNAALTEAHAQVSEALEQQTATSEILRVISSSPGDIQPVFDAIAAHAARLCDAVNGLVIRFDGQLLHLAADYNVDPERLAAVRQAYPRPPSRGALSGRAILTRAVVHVPDVSKDPEYTLPAATTIGYRSVLAVPMMHEGVARGTILVARDVVAPFSDTHIALIQTFADQAVIAIENVRLFTELQARTQELTRSVEQLTALGDVGRAVSSSLDLDTVLTTIVGRAVQLSGADGGTIFEYDERTEEFLPRATLNADEGQSAMLRATRLRRGEGAVGQMAVTREPIQIPDISAEGAYESRIRGAMLASGTRSVLAIPLLHEERVVGGLVVTRRSPGVFTAEVVEILRTFATQSALAIQNARLFRQLEIKSRELEVASQHKSEFLASMSHELRTPLNAVIGFSDVLLQGMFGETNEKQTEYLRDILASGQHLLSLINDILDLSKIEAGRMELDLTTFDLPTAIDDALLLMRERAGRRGITLERQVDERVGEIRADQRKVKQVLLNLLSNAVKFTPEGGRIDVRAGLANGTVEIAVTDTGIGIAPEDHDAVFEEFRQVGAADKKAEGTGLGLALCRKFVELHGGRIWVKSQVGVGSTFTFTLPLSR